jgi:hypothetical protein
MEQSKKGDVMSIQMKETLEDKLGIMLLKLHGMADNFTINLKGLILSSQI